MQVFPYTIIDKLRKSHKICIAVSLDFGGDRRWSFAPSGFNLAEKRFDGELFNQPTVGPTFDLINLKFGIQSVNFTVSNRNRLQDQEIREWFDNATGYVYLCADGMTWDEITTYCTLLAGPVRRESYTEFDYNFTVYEPTLRRADKMPLSTINDTTWPNHRKYGGGGSVSGQYSPVIFGEWDRGVPLKCVDTAAFKYVVSSYALEGTTDALYTAGTIDVFDKDGNVVSPTAYTYSVSADADGIVSSIITFGSNYAAYEPLTCGFYGLSDGTGAVLTHPSDFMLYLLQRRSFIPYNEGSFINLKSTYPNYKFRSHVQTETDVMKFINRILYQLLCGFTTMPDGTMGVIIYDPDAPVSRKLVLTKANMLSDPVVSHTPEEKQVNILKINYNYNPATRSYESTYTIDRSNNSDAEQSYYLGGELPTVELNLPDVYTEVVAISTGIKYLGFFALQHDVLTVKLLHHEGMLLQGGMVVEVTAEIGPGGGWTDEPFLVLDRKVSSAGVTLRLWKIEGLVPPAKTS